MINLIFVVGLENINHTMIDAYAEMITHELQKIMTEENPKIKTTITYGGLLEEWLCISDSTTSNQKL